MSELKNWRKTALNQRYPYSCVPTGYEWLIYYNNLQDAITGMGDIQQAFDLGYSNTFGSVRDKAIKTLEEKSLAIEGFTKNVKVVSYPTTKAGWDERLKQIDKLLTKDIACVLPVRTPTDWHIMPVIRLENDEIWLLRRNFEGVRSIDIMNIRIMRRYFLNEEGGEDLAWIEKKKPILSLR